MSAVTKRSRKRILGLFTIQELALMGLPLLFVGSLHASLKPLLGLLYMVGRGGGCTLERALEAQQQSTLQYNVIQEVNAQSKMVEDKESQLQRWTTPWGVFWSPPETSVPFLIAEQKMRIYGDGPRRVQPGDVVLDAGANIGTFTREALLAGASKVVAIEPSERNVECLKRNFAKEIAEGRVVVYPKGVWHQDEVLEFNVYENSALDSLVMKERMESTSKPTVVKVPVTTVDRIVAELGLERVDFIKMDIEGAERNALRGAAQTIGRMRPQMAVATENLEDDWKVVPEVLRTIRADYRSDCGPCPLIDGRLPDPAGRSLLLLTALVRPGGFAVHLSVSNEICLSGKAGSRASNRERFCALHHQQQRDHHWRGGKRIILAAPLTETIDHGGYFIQMALASLPRRLDLERSADGSARFMPAGVRLVEASRLREFTAADIVCWYPEDLPKFIGPDTRAIGVSTHNPLGVTFAAGVYVSIFGSSGLRKSRSIPTTPRRPSAGRMAGEPVASKSTPLLVPVIG